MFESYRTHHKINHLQPFCLPSESQSGWATGWAVVSRMPVIY